MIVKDSIKYSGDIVGYSNKIQRGKTIMKTQMLNTNQMILLQKQRVAAEKTRQLILNDLKEGKLTTDDLIRNKYLNHAVFENYF
jgi:hypothetical protein